MRMNRYILSLLISIGVLFSRPSIAQVLTTERHVPIITDSLDVYKLPYVHIMDSGRNCLWDFSNISTDSAEVIEIDYFAQSVDTSCIGLHREHTNRYFRYANDTLWLTGYETSRTQMQYTSSLPCIHFPFAYSDSLSGTFTGKGQYCHMYPLSVEGTYSIYADATGRLVLPDVMVDTALRVHIIKRYCEVAWKHNYVDEEHYQWYSPYCRYPLFETTHVQTINGNDTVSFASSYYLPQEEDMQELRREEQDSLAEPIDSLITDVTYLPNPVYSDLQIHYSLVRSAKVYISLHYNGGATTYQTPVRQEEEGHHSVPINMAGLPVGTYVVYIHADDIVVSGNIIKL